MVTKDDAYLHNADSQFLPGDHIDICQFEDNEDGNKRFRIVCHALKRLLVADPGLVKRGRQYVLFTHAHSKEIPSYIR